LSDYRRLLAAVLRQLHCPFHTLKTVHIVRLDQTEYLQCFESLNTVILGRKSLRHRIDSERLTAIE
jgi:hypothetical protein